MSRHLLSGACSPGSSGGPRRATGRALVTPSLDPQAPSVTPDAYVGGWGSSRTPAALPGQCGPSSGGRTAVRDLVAAAVAPPWRVAVRRSPGGGHSLALSHSDPALDGAAAAASARRAPPSPPPLLFSAGPAQRLLPSAPVAQHLHALDRRCLSRYGSFLPPTPQGYGTRSVCGSPRSCVC